MKQTITFEKVLEQLGCNTPDEFYEKMSQYWDDCNDAMLVFNPHIGEGKFESIPREDWFYSEKGEIVLAKLSKPDWRNYEVEDLFDEEELQEINNDYDGDWSLWLEKNPDYSLDERVKEAGEAYFENAWFAFYDSMNAKLAEIQQENQ